jgi:hypothetical protein
MRRFALLLAISLLTAACGSDGAVGVANVKDLVPSARYPTHFAGLPPEGAHASTPAGGKLVLSLNLRTWPGFASHVWSVYADGRMVWQKWTRSGDPLVIPHGARRIDTGYVEQRLTPQGVQLLRSKILATGLVEHSLKLHVRRHAWVNVQIRRGNRMVSVVTLTTLEPSWKYTKPAPAQARGLAQIDALLADPAASLPTTAWADREVRAFVPSHYLAAFDRGAPDISKLPSPVRELLAHYKKLLRRGCLIVTTGEARAILQAFVEAGIPPAGNHAQSIDFGLKGLRTIPSDLHFSPALPTDHC